MSTSNHSEPSEDDLRDAPVLPGFELADHVTLGRGVVLGEGLEPEDIGVVSFLKLRDPRRPATQADLAREMQEHGWKMGKTRFAAIFQRLKRAGHIKHVPGYNRETGRPEWRIEFFLNPANNDQYVNSGILALPQARAEILETGNPQTERLFENQDSGVSPGQKESQVSGNPEGIPGFQDFGPADVAAGQEGNPENRVFGRTPPHPPEEEVGTTSPSPHKNATASRRDKQQQPDVDAAALAAAAQFLMRLPGLWAVGIKRAESLAPWLVRNAELTGWDLNIELRMYLCRPEPGKKPIENYGAVLGYRIKDMQPRDAVLAAAAEPDLPEQGEQEPARPQVTAWCGECDSPEYRWVIPDVGRSTQCPTCNPAVLARRAGKA